MKKLNIYDHFKLAYTIDEFAEVSTLGRTKIYEEIKNGNLIARKIGKRTLILISDAINYLNNLEQLKI